MPSKHAKRLLFPITALFVLFSIFILLPSSSVLSQSLIVTTFPIGTGATGQPGVNDSVTRQIVRASNDQLYVFGGQAQGSTHIVAYWTTATGIPTASTDFNGSTSTTATGVVISVDAVYGGGSTIHVLANDESGKLNDYPFDTTTNTFKSSQPVASDSHSISGDYIGTVGVSGMVDLSDNLQVAYWNSSNHIMFRSFSYNATTNALSLVSGPTQIDSAGSSNHPSLAVSPADDSVTIAWVSQATSTPQILSRVRSSNGTLGSILTVSTAKVWTSTVEGINIDQGPGLVIDSTGKRHLTYIEDAISGGAYGGVYGHVHYATSTGSTWTDNVVSITGGPYPGAFYSHDPALAIDNNDQIYMIAHGPPTSSANKTLYITEKTGTNSWGALQLVNSPPSGSSFDASVSVKWSVKGWNRPNVVEFLYFLANGGNYNNTTFYYGHLPPAVFVPTPTPTPNYATPPARNYYTTSTPTLTWSRVTGAVKYEVELDNSASFGVPVLFDSTIDAPTLNVLVTPALDPGTYYWRVRALNSSGIPGAWSPTETIVING